MTRRIGPIIAIANFVFISSLLFADDPMITGEIVNPRTFSVTQGDHISGGLAELLVCDDNDLSVRRSAIDTTGKVTVEAVTVAPEADPFKFYIFLESSVFARSAVEQTIELYNYTLDDWELVHTQFASHIVDSNVLHKPLPEPFSRFIHKKSLEMKVRVTYRSINRRQKFSANIDRIGWLFPAPPE